MKTIIYKKIKPLAGMASTYDYISRPHCVEEIQKFDYLVPTEKLTLVLKGEKLSISGVIFELDTQTLKILIH